MRASDTAMIADVTMVSEDTMEFGFWLKIKYERNVVVSFEKKSSVQDLSSRAKTVLQKN